MLFVGLGQSRDSALEAPEDGVCSSHCWMLQSSKNGNLMNDLQIRQLKHLQSGCQSSKNGNLNSRVRHPPSPSYPSSVLECLREYAQQIVHLISAHSIQFLKVWMVKVVKHERGHPASCSHRPHPSHSQPHCVVLRTPISIRWSAHSIQWTPPPYPLVVHPQTVDNEVWQRHSQCLIESEMVRYWSCWTRSWSVPSLFGTAPSSPFGLGLQSVICWIPRKPLHSPSDVRHPHQNQAVSDAKSFFDF